MKNKVISAVLALTMAAALMLPVFAEEYDPSPNVPAPTPSPVVTPVPPTPPPATPQPTQAPLPTQTPQAPQATTEPLPTAVPQQPSPVPQPSANPIKGVSEEKKPVAVDNNGQEKTLTVVKTESNGTNSLVLSGKNTATGLDVAGGQRNNDGSVTVSGSNIQTTQEERKTILENKESTIILTSADDMTIMLANFQINETNENTKSSQAMPQLVQNGTTVNDAVRTYAVSTVAQSNKSTSQKLEALSDNAKPIVQQDTKKSVEKVKETASVKADAMKKASEIVSTTTTAKNEKIDVPAVRAQLAAESEDSAKAFDAVVEQLESKGYEVTPAAIEKVVENQEKHQQVLKDLEEGNTDRLDVYTTFDLSVSPDLQDQIQNGGSVKVTLEAEGVTEDDIVVAIKPEQQDNTDEVEDTNFDQMVQDIDNGYSGKVLKDMGNDFVSVPVEVGNGEVTLTLNSLSPIMLLRYADTTTDLEVEETVAEMVPEVPDESIAEESAQVVEEKKGLGAGPIVGIAAALLACLGGGAYFIKKKKSHV